MTISDHAALPAINSLWKAGDGRIMRVTAITMTPHARGGGWAELDVLPPYQPRQRRKTQMSLAEFGDFLQPQSNQNLVSEPESAPAP